MKKFRQIADKIAGILLVATVVLAAIKFGTLATLPETPAIFPKEIAGYFFIGLPAPVFGIVAAIILFLELLAGKTFSFRSPSGFLALLFGFFIPLGALLGAIHSPVSWIVGDHVAYYAGCGAFALAAKLFAGDDEKRKNLLFAGAGIAALLVSVAAIEQYFFGFARMRAFVAAEIARGIPYSAPMLAKVADTRVFATMTSANVLAGFLLLTAPLAIVAAAKFGDRIYPKAYGKQVFGMAALLLTTAAFLLTKTRGAFFAALLTLGVAVWLAPIKKYWKFAVLGISIFAVGSGAWFIQTQGRGFSSVRERVSYVATAARLTREAPVTGGGWGSFYLGQMKYKTTPTDEAPRDPHNVLLSFLSQCGIVGVLPVGIALTGALLALYRERRRNAWQRALFWGSAAFLLHSMVEINHLVPGAWGLFGALAVAGAGSTVDAPPQKEETFTIHLLALLLGIATLAASLNLLKRDYAYSRYREALDDKDFPAEIFWQNAALTAAPEFPVIREIAGDTAWHRGDAATAEKWWRQAWQLSPTRPSLCRKLAAAAWARNDEIEAQTWLKKAQELFPSCPTW